MWRCVSYPKRNAEVPLAHICVSDYVPDVPTVAAVLRDQSSLADDRRNAAEKRGNFVARMVKTASDIKERVDEVREGIERLVADCVESPPDNLDQVVDAVEEFETALADGLEQWLQYRRSAFRPGGISQEERRLLAINTDRVVEATRRGAIVARDAKWQLAALLADVEEEEGPLLDSPDALAAHLDSL